MTHPEVPPKVKIGVRLGRRPDDLGRWLTEAAGFDAAGADALWVDFDARPHLDPFAVTAALAAVTSRALLVTSLPERPVQAAATLATIGQLSHGRLVVVADAIPAGVFELIDPAPGLLLRIPGDTEVFEQAPWPEDGDGAGPRWVSAAMPGSRSAWRSTLLDAAQHRLLGLVLPAEPRLLDILRNPDELDERRDLQIAVG